MGYLGYQILWKKGNIFPYDWAFHPHIANALYKFDKAENPENIINAIENIPFEECERLVKYALNNHISGDGA